MEYERVVLLLSEASVPSQWVEQEVEKALEKERRNKSLALIPVRIDDAVFTVNAGWASYLKNTRNIGDFRRWTVPDEYQRHFERLLSALVKPAE